MKKEDMIDYVKSRLASDAQFAVKCLLAIVQHDDGSRDGIGLRSCDRLLWSLALEHKAKGRLSDAQAEAVQRRSSHGHYDALSIIVGGNAKRQT